MTRRHLAQLAALLAYGILACVTVAAATGELTVSNIVAHGFVITVVPAAAGVMVARQRSLTQRLAAANEQLRHEQELRLAAVASRERNRVARELHDVVAHGVSVMVVQAGAARITVRDEPVMARAALREVAASGRAAMTELRRIMGVLRQGDDDAAVPRVGIHGLAALVEGRRAGGLPAQVCVAGAVPELPASTDLALYRIVQEALTNVVKHASSAPTEIQVAFEPGEVDVRMTNASPRPGVTGRRPARSGHGLVGMRERVEACGGALWHGSRPDGGYEVHARLPLARPQPGQTRSRVAGGIARAGGLRRSSMVSTATLTAAVLAVLVADAVTSGDRRGGMIVLAQATEAMACADPEASIESIARIEAAGREALGQMRQILGLLCAEHDPAELRPLLGIEHIHDLIGRSRGAGGLVDLTVTGSPGPLLGGIDVAAYRLVEAVLSHASWAATGRVMISLRFRDDTLELDIAVPESLPDWPDALTREQVMRCHGHISRSALGAGEKITVALPRHLEAAAR